MIFCRTEIQKKEQENKKNTAGLVLIEKILSFPEIADRFNFYF
jgi:hypothetical protein